MTEKEFNLFEEVVDKIVDQKMSLSEALKTLYAKPDAIFFIDVDFLNTPIEAFNFEGRMYNALKRNKVVLLNDIVNICSNKTLVECPGIGKIGAKEMLYRILDYRFENMSPDDKASTIINCIRKNERAA